MHDDWHQRYYEDKEEEKELFPLHLKRVKVMIELEVMADVSKHNTHQIVLCHPNMDGQLTFDVDNLEQAEDALDEYEMDCISDEEPEIEPEPEPVREDPPKLVQNTYQNFYKPFPVPEENKPKPVLKFEPDGPITQSKPQEVDVRVTVEPKKNISIEDHPVVSIMNDVAELTDIWHKLVPKFKAMRKKTGK